MENNQEQIRINNAEIIETLEKSGYLLEVELENILNNKIFLVESNIVYPDPETNKSREIDLQAILIELFGPKNDRYSNDLQFYLYIECINNPQPMVFFVKEDAYFHDMIEDRYQISGKPLYLGSNKHYQNKLTTLLKLKEFHHYANNEEFSTQFCSFTRKKQNKTWMATHEDDHFNCFNKLYDLVNYKINCHYTHMIEEKKNTAVSINFHFPIIVFANDLYKYKIDDNKLEQVNYVKYCHKRIIDKEEKYLIIDIMNKSYFEQYLSLTKFEFEETKRSIYDIEKEIYKYQEVLNVNLRDISNPIKMRTLLE